ncbi:MAG: phage tail assembly chaperone [Alphaproteobacteria bacterium]|nr:phage tail assembly chaperone [Alphaproteobacteria bacterium]
MNNDRPRFPWGRLMQLGLGHMRLAPSEFWRSTPREILAACGAPPQPMLRQNLDELMERFPDQ